MLLVSFVFIESRSPHALMPLRIFRNRDRSAANLIMLCIGTAMFGMFFFLTIFVQTVWGYSALKSGIGYLPMVATIMVMAGVSAQLVPRIGARPLLIAGSVIASGGMFWLSRINEHSTYAGGLLGPMLVTAAGLGMLFMPVTLIALNRGPGPGRRAGGQPAQRRPAGRRLDRAGPARHRGLDRGGQHRAALGRGREGGRRHRRQGRPSGARLRRPRRSQPPLAIYDHALSIGFSRGFEVSAGIMLIALIVSIAFVRVKRADLAGAQTQLDSPAGDLVTREAIEVELR